LPDFRDNHVEDLLYREALARAQIECAARTSCKEPPKRRHMRIG
jgi:hypothetical protein